MRHAKSFKAWCGQLVKGEEGERLVQRMYQFVDDSAGKKTKKKKKRKTKRLLDFDTATELCGPPGLDVCQATKGKQRGTVGDDDDDGDEDRDEL